MKLGQENRDFIELIDRSCKKRGDDWSRCNKIFLPYIKRLPEELIEIKEVEKEIFVKLSPKGKIILKWIELLRRKENIDHKEVIETFEVVARELLSKG